MDVCPRAPENRDGHLDRDGCPDVGGPGVQAAPVFRATPVSPEVSDREIVPVAPEGAAGAEQPFFLYLPLTSPHTPIAPAPEFLGASGVSPYGDFCVETDARVGQVLDVDRLDAVDGGHVDVGHDVEDGEDRRCGDKQRCRK